MGAYLIFIMGPLAALQLRRAFEGGGSGGTTGVGMWRALARVGQLPSRAALELALVASRPVSLMSVNPKSIDMGVAALQQPRSWRCRAGIALVRLAAAGAAAL